MYCAQTLVVKDTQSSPFRSVTVPVGVCHLAGLVYAIKSALQHPCQSDQSVRALDAGRRLVWFR